MNCLYFIRKLIIVLVIFYLIGTVSKAFHDYEEDQKCYEEKKEETIEEKVETSYESVSEITTSKWFLFLNKIIEKYPIIERIIERILQWIINNLLDFDY